MNTVAVVDIGRTRYADAWKLQQKLFELRHYGLIGDVFLFTEHEHVYTLGKGADGNHVLASAGELAESGVDLFHIDRGGDVTYHGPGQIVGYPILDLNNYFNDIHRYLRCLEEVMIRTLMEYGIESEREEGMTGVWVKGEKIAALGVKVSRWITMHGFAFNVNTDLSYFGRIIPCGIFHKGVTSMRQLLGNDIPLREVQNRLVEEFGNVFGCSVQTVALEELTQRIASLDVSQP
jgi:lipoyl(octanoyl) transferase